MVVRLWSNYLLTPQKVDVMVPLRHTTPSRKWIFLLSGALEVILSWDFSGGNNKNKPLLLMVLLLAVV